MLMLHLVCGLCFALPPSGVSLSARLPALRALTAAPAGSGQHASLFAGRTRASSPLTSRTGSLSATIALGDARRLTLSATPSPARCAPLIQLDF